MMLLTIWDAVHYPVWQKRFKGWTKDDINDQLSNQNVSWTAFNTLRTEWKMPGFRLHPITNKMVWFNQLYAMNGRYFNGHNVNGMSDIPLHERPLHSLIGNGRELTDKEYYLLDAIHHETAVLIPWDHTGDILAVDNFAFQHGRTSYDSYRNCVLHWGDAVSGGEYVYDSKHFIDIDIDAVKNDIYAMYQLLDHFRWFDTMFKYVLYRLNDDKILLGGNSGATRVISYSSYEIKEIYRNILEYREDINVLIHVINPDIAAVVMSSHGFLPIDQSYYMLGIEQGLILMEQNSIIVLGSTIEEAFTRLYYAICAAKSQVLALSIHESVQDVIFPTKYIQNITFHQALNFNVDGYGHLEFKAWKRRYRLDNTQSDDTERVSFSFDESELRKDVAKAYNVLDKLQWTESIYQHITATLPSNDDIMLINAFGLEFGEVTADNLMKVRMNGSILHGGNSFRAGFINPAGLRLHSAVHEARLDAKVVIHCHHPAISAISVHSRGLILDVMDIGYRELIGSVKYHPFDSLSLAINKRVLRDALSDGSNVIILRNHGILTIGETVKDAFNRLYYSIYAAEIQIKSMIQKEENVNNFVEVCNNKTDGYFDVWSRF